MKVYILIGSILVIAGCVTAPRYYTEYNESSYLIIIQDDIGDVIDADERMTYSLFHGIDNFQEARIHELSHGGYVARIMAGEDEYIAVNADVQAIPILRDYIARHDEIIANRQAFEDTWQIAAYDDLGQPITEDEITQMKTTKSCLYTYFTGGCVGTLSGAMIGLIIGLWDASEHPGSIDIPNLAPIIGPIIGAIGGFVIGVVASSSYTSREHVINTIKKARQLRRLDD